MEIFNLCIFFKNQAVQSHDKYAIILKIKLTIYRVRVKTKNKTIHYNVKKPRIY